MTLGWKAQATQHGLYRPCLSVSGGLKPHPTITPVGRALRRAAAPPLPLTHDTPRAERTAHLEPPTTDLTFHCDRRPTQYPKTMIMGSKAHATRHGLSRPCLSVSRGMKPRPTITPVGRVVRCAAAPPSPTHTTRRAAAPPLPQHTQGTPRAERTAHLTPLTPDPSPCGDRRSSPNTNSAASR
jgi:hypothetical protein